MADILFGGWLGGPDVALLLLRVTIGVFFLLARFRWFYDPARGWFCPYRRELLHTRLCTCGYGASYPLCTLVAVTEVFGGLALIIGLLTPLAALGIAIVMVFGFCCVAREEIQAMHPVDHIDEWAKALYLCEPLYFVMCLVLVFSGPGRYSLDSFILQRLGG